MKRWLQDVAFTLLLGGLIILGAIAYAFVEFLDTPSPVTRRVMIEKGWGPKKIALHLESQGVVNSSVWFGWLMRMHLPGSIRLHAGEYQIHAGESPASLLIRMEHGDVVRHRFSFPEGMTVEEVASRLRKHGWHEAEGRLKDAALPRKLGVTAPSLEGWLFPETYQYVRGDTIEEMLTRMVRMTKKVLEREWNARAPEMNLTPLEALTLASIIEKETGRAEERTRISGVFHNRLRKHMRLESDPTVIYGLPDFDGDLTRKDLATPTPFNTYVIHGLPPTPICNPGEASIHAALHPDATEELFFVATGDGTHQFSKTYAEHRAKVNRYQRGVRSEGSAAREKNVQP
ncbi:MAG: endolytic transglycosylase MltG [Magnetococcus sp. YQC-9]